MLPLCQTIGILFSQPECQWQDSTNSEISLQRKSAKEAWPLYKNSVSINDIKALSRWYTLEGKYKCLEPFSCFKNQATGNVVEARTFLTKQQIFTGTHKTLFFFGFQVMKETLFWCLLCLQQRNTVCRLKSPAIFSNEIGVNQKLGSQCHFMQTFSL